MLDWITCINTFQNIVESGSFTQTAKNLHTTPSAISKRINWLEDTLSVPLFHRSTRQVNVTEAGQALFDRSLPLLNEWNEIKAAVSTQHHEANGVLRIGVSIGFGSKHVVEMLPGFMDEYPNITVDLKLTNCVSQLSSQQIDIFICHDLRHHNKDSFHTQEILDIHNQLYAAPKYLEKHGKPTSLSDLKNHNCITIHCEGANLEWDFGDEKITVSGNLSTNNTTAAINAAISGLGIISMCPSMIKKELKREKLVPLFPNRRILPRKMNAYYPKQKFIPKKISAFIEYMDNYFMECRKS